MSGPNPKSGRSILFAFDSSTGIGHCVAIFSEEPQMLNLPASPPSMLVDVVFGPAN